MKRETVIITSDLSGEEGAETRHLFLDVELDLTDAEYRTINDIIAKYQAKGRAVIRGTRKARREAGALVPWREQMAHREATRAERQWLRDHGWPVGPSGRIPSEAHKAYADRTPHPSWVDPAAPKPEETAVVVELPEAPTEAPKRTAAARKAATPKVTEVPPSAKTRRAATTEKVVAATTATPRRSRTARAKVPPVELATGKS